MLCNYFFDRRLYAFDRSQYFALAFQELFWCRLSIWVDVSGEEERYLHTCVEFQPGFYLDALGVFRDPRDRFYLFPDSHIALHCCTRSFAKNKLRQLHIPFDDKDALSVARNYLMDNMLVLETDDGRDREQVGLFASTYDNFVSFLPFDPDTGSFDSRFHSLPPKRFSDRYCGCCGWHSYPDWYDKLI